MESPRVYIVHLRRPKSASQNPNEMRSDPFWEFGSFGCTGCHSKNLLSPRNAPILEGARLAFAHGGHDGFRLVYLTPPVTVVRHRSRFEIRWPEPQMPFRYGAAPILVRNDGKSDVPLLRDMASKTRRSKLEGGFSSLFRSRALPLVASVADQLVTAYERTRASASPPEIAGCYSEALPYPPPVIDKARKETYKTLVERADAEGGVGLKSRCSSSKPTPRIAAKC